MRDEPTHHDEVAQPPAVDLALDRRAPGAVAHDLEAHGRAALGKQRDGLEQIRVPLDLDQPRRDHDARRRGQVAHGALPRGGDAHVDDDDLRGVGVGARRQLLGSEAVDGTDERRRADLRGQQVVLGDVPAMRREAERDAGHLTREHRQRCGRRGPMGVQVAHAVGTDVLGQPESLRDDGEVLREHAERTAHAQAPDRARDTRGRAQERSRAPGDDAGRDEPGLEGAVDEVEAIRSDRRGLPLARADDDLDALALELVDLRHDEVLAVAERQRCGDIDDPRARAVRGRSGRTKAHDGGLSLVAERTRRAGQVSEISCVS